MIGLLMLAAVGAGAPQTAAFLTGNDLYENCSDGGVNRLTLCVPYVEGIFDATNVQRALMKLPPIICSGISVTASQIADVVHLYLKNHPERRQNPAAQLAVTALSEAFPCNKGG